MWNSTHADTTAVYHPDTDYVKNIGQWAVQLYNPHHPQDDSFSTKVHKVPYVSFYSQKDWQGHVVGVELLVEYLVTAHNLVVTMW